MTAVGAAVISPTDTLSIALGGLRAITQAHTLGASKSGFSN